MTPAEFTLAMAICGDVHDLEMAHSDADDLMCDLLTELGYGEGVAVFQAMDKWYA